jgi:hypothetical protein
MRSKLRRMELALNEPDLKLAEWKCRIVSRGAPPNLREIKKALPTESARQRSTA